MTKPRGDDCDQVSDCMDAEGIAMPAGVDTRARRIASCDAVLALADNGDPDREGAKHCAARLKSALQG